MQGRWFIFCFFYTAVTYAWVFNNPYPASESKQSIFYSSFATQPKTLDPAKSYDAAESVFISQVDEPLLEYHYLKRPYQLVPLTASQMPEVQYFNSKHEVIKDIEKEEVEYSVYTIHIQPGIYYQYHPAFAKGKDGRYLYLDLPNNYLESQSIRTLSDFEEKGTRELIVDDFIYEIKRLASPYINSPIYGLMQDYIVGFQDLNKALLKASNTTWIDLRQYSLSGVEKIDDYTFKIYIKGQYRSFLYWLAMYFFAPVPWEAEKFYAQAGMAEKNIGMDWNPVGTGPFILTENNPNARMVLTRNREYRPVLFPSEGGEAEDKTRGYLKHAGKRLPLIDKVVFTLEKEAIPRWNKFLQGYYDTSTVSADSFEQAVRVNRYGVDELSQEMRSKQIRLRQTVEPSVFYLGFNMLDPIVGGASERARLLRLAISLAVNTEERIALFYNGRGEAANSPIPPGVFGYQTGLAGMNPWIYERSGHSFQRRPIKLAKTWMRLAGYPGGINLKTGKPLMLHYDASASGGPDEKAELEWIRKQLAKIGISLNVRATQYNRFQEKVRTGNVQLFSLGWKADYPDPENFLFLLYGPNGRVHYSGENVTNYENPEFDRLFNQMKNRENDAKRAALIKQMLGLIQHDAPWIWGLYSKTLVLSQAWVSPVKPSTMSSSTLKYVSVDPIRRDQMRSTWNQVILWPLWIALFALALFLLPLILVHLRQERRVVSRFEESE